MARKPRHEDEMEEEIIYVSKSELKRDAKALKELGESLLKYTPQQWQQMALDEELVDALELAVKIKNTREGYRRQLQYIGRVLRNCDHEAIVAAMNKLGNTDKSAELALQKLERVRADLLANGMGAINQLVGQYPEFERQKLRQLVKKTLTQQQKQPEQTSPAFKELFQYLKEVIQ